MELSFLFSSIIILFVSLAVIGTISHKNLKEYSSSNYAYFLTIFASTSIFVLGVLFVQDSWKQYQERNKKKNN